MRPEGSDKLLQTPVTKPLLDWRCAQAGGTNWLLHYGRSLDGPAHSEEFISMVVVSLLRSFRGKSPVKQGGNLLICILQAKPSGIKKNKPQDLILINAR